MRNKSYATDLTDRQWESIKDQLPPPKPDGRRRTTDLRLGRGERYQKGRAAARLPAEGGRSITTAASGAKRASGGGGTTRCARVGRQAGRHKHPTAGRVRRCAASGWMARIAASRSPPSRSAWAWFGGASCGPPGLKDSPCSPAPGWLSAPSPGFHVRGGCAVMTSDYPSRAKLGFTSS